MSIYDFHYSMKLSTYDPPFYALLMCMIRKADTDNLRKIESVFPEVVKEFVERYRSPLGKLATDDIEVSDRRLIEQIEGMHL